jgi:ferrous-iron efflux pump FieF
MDETPRYKPPNRLIGATVIGSLILAGALFGVYRLFSSQTALAQAADSLSDVLGGAALLWAVRASHGPPDEEHPTGHDRAESIGALIVAVLAGVLAVEVMRSAISALLSGASPALDWPAASVFAAKVVFKALIAWIAQVRLRLRRNPALKALQMDARNDMLIGLLALIGFGLSRIGLPRIDAALAVGIAIYIGYAGLRLGRENVSLLLGESASPEHRQQLALAARTVDGVRGVHDVIAIWHGHQLHVQLTAAVSGSLQVDEAHAIGHAVERRLLAEHDVREATVHVEPHAPGPKDS